MDETIYEQPQTTWWLVCHECGRKWPERTAINVRKPECCNSDYYWKLHVHSDRDGEQPPNEYELAWLQSTMRSFDSVRVTEVYSKKHCIRCRSTNVHEYTQLFDSIEYKCMDCRLIFNGYCLPLDEWDTISFGTRSNKLRRNG